MSDGIVLQCLRTAYINYNLLDSSEPIYNNGAIYTEQSKSRLI